MALLREFFIGSCVLFITTLAVQNTVDLNYTKYQGLALANGISQWLGIRYAAPPIGDLRFMPPQDPPYNDTIQVADTHGLICLATGAEPNVTTTSEDCLFLDVYAPSNATTTSKLPVFFFIQGGGFNLNSNPNLNGSGLITASGYDMVFVCLNYRVGPYGFITDGDQITPNNGLRDQRKALEWVQKYISKFGGNPDHVVLGGASAGAESIALHLTANGGQNLNLFHAAAAESPSFANTLTIDQAQYMYVNLAIRLGCAGDNSLACLRSKSAAEIQAENFNIPFPDAASAPLYQWIPVLDNDIVTDYSYRAFQQGKFIRVPTIFGDDSNGGTKFAPENTTTLAESDQFIYNQYPLLTLEQLGQINQLYPNPNNTCPGVGCYWRQTANVYGEMRYMCPALYVTAAMSQYGVNHSYAYRWNVEDPDQIAEGLGVPHTVEVNALIGPEYSTNPPTSYEAGGINAKASPVMQGYWTSFIRSMDPNKYRYPGTAVWREWSNYHGRLLFSTGGNTSMEAIDAGLKQRCDYWASVAVDLTM